MTPTTLFANLRSLQREQPATYGAAFKATPEMLAVRAIDKRYLFERRRDGYDDWRERCVLSGVPIPNCDMMHKLQMFQLTTDSDAIGAYIRIYNQLNNGPLRHI